jgi:hemerythrin-like domain-containing protein
MTSTAPHLRPRSRRTIDDSIKGSLRVLEEMLTQAADHMFEAAYVEDVATELRRLRARVRIHHGTDSRSTKRNSADRGAPGLAAQGSHLQSEHATISGQLRQLLRSAGSIADQSLEDKEVFILRAQELIAVLRRHEAEEDRLFYLSVWGDMGENG